jgi:hypothetical protein
MEAFKTITKLTDEVLSSQAYDAKLALDFSEKLRENMEKCQSEASKAIYLFVAFSTTRFLIFYSIVPKVAVLGIELNNPRLLLTMLMFLSVFIYYRFVTLTAFAAILEACLRKIYEATYTEYSSRGLTDLLNYPSFYGIENAIDNIGDNSDTTVYRINTAWIICIFIIMIVVPPLFLIWLSYSTIVLASLNVVLTILVSVIVILLLSRVVIVMIQAFRLAA